MGAAWESNRELGGRRPGLLRILGIGDPNGGPVPTRRWKLKPGGNLLVIGNRVTWGRLMERARQWGRCCCGVCSWRAGAGMVLEKRLQKQTGPKLPVRLTGPRAGAQRTGVLSTGVMDKTVTPKEPGGTGTRSAGFTQRVLENIAALQEHRATGYDPGRACAGGVR